MKSDSLFTWRSLTAGGSVRVLKYTFGPGTANMLAVQLEDGSWLVVSPASGAQPFVLEDLVDGGTVSALVAPNGYHHLGQQQWRERFPEAVSYAPEGALPRLAQKSPGIAYHRLAELAERVGSRVELVIPRGLRAPDLLLRVSVPGDTVWWLGDLFSNSSAADQVWWLRHILAPLAGSGLGYRRNRKPGLVYVRDSAEWLSSLRESVGHHLPSIAVPAHGDPVVEDAAARTERLLADSL